MTLILLHDPRDEQILSSFLQQVSHPTTPVKPVVQALLKTALSNYTSGTVPSVPQPTHRPSDVEDVCRPLVSYTTCNITYADMNCNSHKGPHCL